MKKTIQNALLQILETTPISTITVKDISNVANIHRATFYVYFSSKEELYETIIEDILYDLELAIKPSPTLTYSAIKHLYHNQQSFLNEALLFIQHIQKNKKVYIALLKDYQFQNQFITVIFRCMMLGNILPDIYTRHLAHGTVGLVQEWLEKEEESAEELAIYLTQINLHALVNYPKIVSGTRKIHYNL